MKRLWLSFRAFAGQIALGLESIARTNYNCLALPLAFGFSAELVGVQPEPDLAVSPLNISSISSIASGCECSVLSASDSLGACGHSASQ